MNNIVVFDIDGVLADYEGRLVSILYERFGSVAYEYRNLYRLENRFETRTDVLDFAKRLTANPNMYYGLDVIEGAEDFANRLVKEGVWIVYVSGRPKSAENFTRRWLMKNFMGQMGEVNCGVIDKAKFLTESEFGVEFGNDIDFVVEDNPDQIKKLKDAGFTVFCFDQEWNKGIFPRIYVRSDGEIMFWRNEDIEAQPFFEIYFDRRMA